MEDPDAKTTYSNCYVLEAPSDNLESIFDCAKILPEHTVMAEVSELTYLGLHRRGLRSEMQQKNPPARFLLWIYTPW